MEVLLCFYTSSLLCTCLCFYSLSYSLSSFCGLTFLWNMWEAISPSSVEFFYYAIAKNFGFRTVCTERTASSFCSFSHKTTQQILKSSVKAGRGYNKFKFVIWMFQAKHSGESFTGRPDNMIHNQNVNIPPATHLIGDLEPHSLYAVRVACHSSQGPSDWSPWVELRTKEGGEPSKWGDVCFQCVLVCVCVCGIISSEVGQG